MACFTGVVACKNVDRSLPSFVWQNEESPFGVPILKIKFYDGGDDDSALLRKYNPIPMGPMERSDSVDDCIYNGFLSKESDVHVTVTGCAMSNNFQVKLNKSNRGLHSYAAGPSDELIPMALYHMGKTKEKYIGTALNL
jgi:hypothetical protein